MLYDKIYTVNWKRLARWVLPVIKRKPVLLAIVYALAAPINTVYILFLKYRAAKQYQLLITPQVCYLERMLNDRYDITLRRIYIEDAEWFTPQYLYLEDELKPLYLYTEAENKPVYFRTEEEAGDTLADFVVWYPAALVFELNEMKSLLDSYKLAGKRYKIVPYV